MELKLKWDNNMRVYWVRLQGGAGTPGAGNSVYKHKMISTKINN